MAAPRESGLIAAPPPSSVTLMFFWGECLASANCLREGSTGCPRNSCPSVVRMGLKHSEESGILQGHQGTCQGQPVSKALRDFFLRVNRSTLVCLSPQVTCGTAVGVREDKQWGHWSSTLTGFCSHCLGPWALAPPSPSLPSCSHLRP